MEFKTITFEKCFQKNTEFQLLFNFYKIHFKSVTVVHKHENLHYNIHNDLINKNIHFWLKNKSNKILG